jgi:iron complex transport system substrate-binding protein
MWLALWLAASLWAAGPPRVVSTAPGFTETMYAMGAGALLVGVSEFCHYPQEVEKLPRVGTYLKPNVEAIARLKPDLVLLHAEQRQTVAQLQSLGIRTLALRNTNLEETLTSMRQIGAAIGMEQAGVALQQRIRQRLAALEQKTAGKPRRTLLFLTTRR